MPRVPWPAAIQRSSADVGRDATTGGLGLGAGLWGTSLGGGDFTGGLPTLGPAACKGGKGSPLLIGAWGGDALIGGTDGGGAFHGGAPTLVVVTTRSCVMALAALAVDG